MYQENPVTRKWCQQMARRYAEYIRRTFGDKPGSKRGKKEDSKA